MKKNDLKKQKKSETMIVKKIEMMKDFVFVKENTILQKIKTLFNKFYNLFIFILEIWIWEIKRNLFREQLNAIEGRINILNFNKIPFYTLKKIENSIKNIIVKTNKLTTKIFYLKILSIIKKTKNKRKGKQKIDTLLSELKIWSVLLLNKKKNWKWGILLKYLTKWKIEMTHVLVITGCENNNIKFSHSTGSKFSKNNESWIETQIDLFKYLKQTPADIIIIQPPQKNKNLIKARIKKLNEDEKFTYNGTDAVLSIIGMPKIWKKSFNCWSYAAYLLGLTDKENKLSIPNNRLKDNRLTPSYIFSSYKLE